MKAKYDGTCVRCGKPISVGQDIEWNREEHAAMHHGCVAREAPYDPAYDDNPEERRAAIQRISQYAQARIERERAAQ